ncbi:MAG: hypothetical protein U0525_01180 [Patescibacteria group bacterium]
MKGWDQIGAARVDEFISISNEVAKRCRDNYGIESEVIYPPIDVDKWEKLQDKNGQLEKIKLNKI